MIETANIQNISKTRAQAKAPYKELDSNIVKLVRALNSFEGIRTIGSCGGHANPKPYQRPEGEWEIVFNVDHNEEGWFALEFLTWFVNNNLSRQEHEVYLSLNSFPPSINIPGEALYFGLEGSGVDPDWLAKELRQVKTALYTSASELDAFLIENDE